MQAKILRAADSYFGRMLFVLFWLLSPLMGNGSRNKNVLVIKLWAVGESVMILPSIKALGDMGFKVTVLCTRQNKAVFERQKFVGNLVVFDFLNPFKALSAMLLLRRLRFSAAIDSDPYMRFSPVLAVFSGAPRRYGLENRRLLYTNAVKINEDEHAVLSFYRIFSAFAGFPQPSRLVPLFARPAEIKIPLKSVALHAGSASTSPMRRWPEENFARLCDYFSSHGYVVYLVGSLTEKEINARIAAMCASKPVDLSGLLSLHELAYLFSKSSLVIANDSGPMHIAAAMGTPTVGLFGPNLPGRFGPYGTGCIGIRKDARPPCILPFRARFPECSHDHMSAISVEDVVQAAEKLLKNGE